MPWRETSLFFLCLTFYMANGRPHPEVDCVAAPYTAWAMLTRASMDLQPYAATRRLSKPHVIPLDDGSLVTMRGPGSALACIPALIPLVLTRNEVPRDATMHQVGKLSAALLVALSTLLFYRVALRVAPAGAWLAALLFGLGTCLTSVASQAMWMHGPATFWLCVALFALTKRRDQTDRESLAIRLASGFALGMAALTRPTAAFFGAASFLTAVCQREATRAAMIALGAAGPLGIMVAHNTWFFGAPLSGGYVNDELDRSTPLWLGVGGLLFAPSRGVLIFSPALLLAFPAILGLARGRYQINGARGLLLAWLAASVATLLFYGRWHDWRGGWCYGPRFFCETMPILCLLVAITLDQWQAVWLRWIARALVALSIYIHFLGIYGYGGYAAWQERHQIADGGRSLFELNDTQIEAHHRSLWSKLLGALAQLAPDSTMDADSLDKNHPLPPP